MHASTDTLPRITVIAITPDCYATLRQTVRHLGAQTIADAIELLICIRSRSELHEVSSELEMFHSWKVVELGEFTTMGAAKLAALQQAHAPFVVFAEDHSFPQPTWAAALVEAHADGHIAAAPQMQNANPRSVLSWADMFLGFGSWISPLPPGVYEYLPGHNTGYDRATLLSFGSDLAPLLENERLLQTRLRAQGRTLFLVPACTRHVNASLFGSFLRVQYHGGRSFGGGRAVDQSWPWYRRVIHVGGAPLVPLLRLRRTLAMFRESGRAKEVRPKMLAALFVGLCAHATGEAIGTALGAGSSTRKKSDFEFHRDHHVREEDKAVWAIP